MVAYRSPKPRGQMLVVVLLLGIVAATLTPMIVRMFRQEAKTSVWSHHKDNARRITLEVFKQFNQKITTLDLLRDLRSGALVYDGTTVYQDIPGGEYKIICTTGTDSLPLRVRVIARTGPGHPPVAAERVYTLSRATPAPYNIQLGSTAIFEVHWGPLYGYNIYLNAPTAALGFPRKIAGSSISPLDTSSAEPNTDGASYWAYGSYPNNDANYLEWPHVDLNYYSQRARESSVPSTTATGRLIAGKLRNHAAVASPPGSGYFVQEENAFAGDFDCATLTFERTSGTGIGYEFDSSTSVIMMTDSVSKFRFANNFNNCTEHLVIGAYSFFNVEAIVAPNIDLYGPGGRTWNAVIPAGADREYASAAGAAVWTAGSPSMASVYASPGRCCYPVPETLVHGALLPNALVRFFNDVNIVGVTKDIQGVGTSPRIRIYYDEDIATTAESLSGQPIQFIGASW